MMRAMAIAGVLTVLCAGAAYSQSSVTASATVVGTLDASEASITVRAGVGMLMIQAGSARGSSRGVLEYVQVTRVTDHDRGVIDVEDVAEVDIDETDDVYIIVTRVIASNS